MTTNDASETGDQQTRMDSRAAIHPFPNRSSPEPDRREGAVVSFDRHELREILNVYGRGVANGDWKDYAIDFMPQKSVFAIYRRASEVPLYRIEKDPALTRKQGAYAVMNATGFVLKRGHELARVLRVLETKPRLSVV